MLLNASDLIERTTQNSINWLSSYAECPLLKIDSDANRIRLVMELIQLIGAFLYIVAALRESKFLGYKMFIENLVCFKKSIASIMIHFCRKQN